MRPTNVIAQINEPDTIVFRGTTVPFDGVLVSEPNYRLYQDRELELDMALRDLKKTPPPEPPMITNNTETKIVFFLSGLVVGYAASFVIHK